MMMMMQFTNYVLTTIKLQLINRLISTALKLSRVQCELE